MRQILSILDKLFIGIWGFTLIDLIPFASTEPFSEIDSTIKTIMAVAGLVYFCITIPHKIRMQKIELKLKKEELSKAIKNNESKNK